MVDIGGAWYKNAVIQHVSACICLAQPSSTSCDQISWTPNPSDICWMQKSEKMVAYISGI